MSKGLVRNYYRYISSKISEAKNSVKDEVTATAEDEDTEVNGDDEDAKTNDNASDHPYEMFIEHTEDPDDIKNDEPPKAPAKTQKGKFLYIMHMQLAFRTLGCMPVSKLIWYFN